MNAATLETLGNSILRAPLSACGVDYFGKTFQGTNITLRLDYAAITVQCDWGMASGVRYQVYVTGQSPSTGISCYVEDVDATTPPAQVRNTLVRMIKTVAGNLQLSMTNLSVTGITAAENM